MSAEKSHLCPLFWQHHEEEAVLREELQRMKENGIGGFIVEARPHPDYLEENWWKDLTILLDEAKKSWTWRCGFLTTAIIPAEKQTVSW